MKCKVLNKWGPTCFWFSFFVNHKFYLCFVIIIAIKIEFSRFCNAYYVTLIHVSLSRIHIFFYLYSCFFVSFKSIDSYYTIYYIYIAFHTLLQDSERPSPLCTSYLTPFTIQFVIYYKFYIKRRFSYIKHCIWKKLRDVQIVLLVLLIT